MHVIDKIRSDPFSLDLTWNAGLLSSIALRWSQPMDELAYQTSWGELFQESLEQYLAGAEVQWPDAPLAWERINDFSRQVLLVLRDLPRGEWLSYGRLAARCGRPKAARAVGRVMASNPWPLLFPCHRVLGGNGQLTGFGPGLKMKEYLLVHEGVPFVATRTPRTNRNDPPDALECCCSTKSCR